MQSEGAVDKAEAYYDSDDADAFYSTVWGGTDIHIGLYQSETEDIASASRRTVGAMADKLTVIDAGSQVLDLGAGYGGAARYLAERFGCHVTCLNLSTVQNAENQRQNAEAGLDDKVRVLHGNFEQVPEPDASADVIWSQDAFLHSGQRERVLDEVARLTRPGGEVVFTDPMQTANADPAGLAPILARIHLASLGSPEFYEAGLAARGFSLVEFEDHTAQMARHYTRVAEVVRSNYDAMVGRCSTDYLDAMLKGLAHWVEGAERGNLCWGIFLFRKAGG